MLKQKKYQKQKKLKTSYYYRDNENEILGKTDNPCRTMINLFTVFRNNHSKEVFFDIDNPKKIMLNKEKSLHFKQIDKDKKYKYQGISINRKEFIILLRCEEKKGTTI